MGATGAAQYIKLNLDAFDASRGLPADFVTPGVFADTAAVLPFANRTSVTPTDWREHCRNRARRHWLTRRCGDLPRGNRRGLSSLNLRPLTSPKLHAEDRRGAGRRTVVYGSQFLLTRRAQHRRRLAKDHGSYFDRRRFNRARVH
jgi:hypothetical protein